MQTSNPLSTRVVKPTNMKMVEANGSRKVTKKSRTSRKVTSRRKTEEKQTYLSSDNELIPVNDIPSPPVLYQSQYQYEFSGPLLDPNPTLNPILSHSKTQPLIEGDSESDDLFDDFVVGNRIRTYLPPCLPKTLDLQDHTILKTEMVPSCLDLEKPALYRLAQVEEAFAVCRKSLLSAQAEIVRLKAAVKLANDNCTNTEIRKNLYKAAWNQKKVKKNIDCAKREC
jgi:hypothetical protein